MRYNILFLCMCCLFTACVPCLYLPSAINMPLSTEKGELKLSATYGSDGFGAQGSYALGSHTVVIADGAYNRPGLSNGDVLNFKSDIGLGYYNHFSKKGVFEIIGGGGYGFAKGYGITNNLSGPEFGRATIDGHFVHEFGQADIGWLEKTTEYGFGVKIVNTSAGGMYLSKEYTGYGTTVNYIYHTDLMKNALFLQPGFMVAAGSKGFKWNFNFGFSIPLRVDDIAPSVGSVYQVFSATTGLKIDLFTAK